MTETTTVRVRKSTHAALSQAVKRSGTSADEVIGAGLAALERERKRRQYEADARRLAADPADRAEVAAAIRELLGE
jgi:Arc/MetJ-type ribon-helix-helix transcriptional regulator